MQIPRRPLPVTVVGEIIEASTTRFVAQCPRGKLHQPPALGTFVKVLPVGARLPTTENRLADTPGDFSSNLSSSLSSPRLLDDEDPFADPPPVTAVSMRLPAIPEETLYALVCAASTGSADVGRRASAYGLEEEALQAEQPQIYDLLATEFVALPFGYIHKGRVRPGLPHRPPRLHAFVDSCDCTEVRALSEAPDFVRQMLHATGDVHPDELIAACLTAVYVCRDEDFAFLVRAGKQLANLLRDDPERLAALLRKLEP